MYRTGRLSYAYFRKWEQLDRKYALTRKFEAVKALSLKKWHEAEEVRGDHEACTTQFFSSSSTHARNGP